MKDPYLEDKLDKFDQEMLLLDKVSIENILNSLTENEQVILMSRVHSRFKSL